MRCSIYKFQFVSNDYADMWDFINNHYDVLSYHDPKKEWVNNEANEFANKVIRMKNAENINNAMFWESEAKKKPSRRERPEKRKKSES